MPPKKGGKKGKKGKAKGAKGKKEVKDVKTEGEATMGEDADNDDVFRDKEELLKEELAKVNQQVDEIKKEIEDLKSENEFLQQEAQRIRVESHEYMSYMEKKVDKRQRTIVTLSDHNQHEIQQLRNMKAEMLAVYDKKKAELRKVLLEKESQLAKARKELEDLSEYKTLRSEQTTKIHDLEKDMQSLRTNQSSELQKLKLKFLEEKRVFEEQSEQGVQELAKAAYKEAMVTLIQHTNSIKLENRTLRKDLLFLIQQTRSHQERKKVLLDQHKELLREKQFAQDLQSLRMTRRSKIQKCLARVGAEGAESQLTTQRTADSY